MSDVPLSTRILRGVYMVVGFPMAVIGVFELFGAAEAGAFLTFLGVVFLLLAGLPDGPVLIGTGVAIGALGVAEVGWAMIHGLFDWGFALTVVVGVGFGALMLGVIAGLGAAFAKKEATPEAYVAHPEAVAAPEAAVVEGTSCPRCGKPGVRYIPQYRRYYCFFCKNYV